MATQTLDRVGVKSAATEALKRRQQRVLKFNVQVWTARIGLRVGKEEWFQRR